MARSIAACALLAASSHASYVHGNHGDCPAGSDEIGDEGECTVGAHAVGWDFQSAGSWPEFPGGCYGNALNGQVWFNTHVGSRQFPYAKVCRTKPPIVPAHVAKGPYSVKSARYRDVQGMDTTGQAIDVWYPIGVVGQTFPLIAFAHGFIDGNKHLANHYVNHLTELAAFGYIIAASEACDWGCSDRATLPDDAWGFEHYYKQQLKVIDWANEVAASDDPIMSTMDLHIGVGIAGHSMGGQSTLFSAGPNATSYGIKAAVMQHAYTHTFPAPTVPFLAFTGTIDDIATPNMTIAYYNAEGAHPIKGIRNKVGMGHLEPSESDEFNPAFASLTAAWFKLYLDETPQKDGIDYHKLIFSQMCDGEYDGAMEQCEVHGSASSLVV